jgi:hypothetical protein
MKTSVYVPDELWDDVKRKEPDAVISQIVQACLRERFVDPPGRPFYAQIDDGLVARRTRLQENLRGGVVKAYRSGYRVGLSFAEGLTAEIFSFLEAAEYDLAEFGKLTEGAELALPDEPGLVYDFETHWASVSVGEGELFDYVDWDHLPAVVRRGMTDALRETWEGASIQQLSAVAHDDERGSRIESAE